MSTLLSFIIPAYNAEKTIKECIKSILKIQNVIYEIIVINDGSTDQTIQKIKEIQDKKVFYYTIKNEGVSNARNYGLALAKGKYVVFVDADDLVIADEFQKVIEKLDGNTEVIMYGYVQSNGKNKINFEIPFPAGEYNNQVCKKLIERLIDIPVYKKRKNDNLGARVWQYVFQKEFLNANDLQFVSKLPFAEDLCFCVAVLGKVKMFKCIDVLAYEYKITSGTASKRYRPNYWEELKGVYQYLSDLLQQEMPYLYLGYSKIAIRHLFFYKVDSQVREQKLKEILGDKKFQNFLRQCKNERKTLIEHIFDFGLDNRRIGLISMILIGQYFPMHLYQKFKNNFCKRKGR